MFIKAQWEEGKRRCVPWAPAEVYEVPKSTDFEGFEHPVFDTVFFFFNGLLEILSQAQMASLEVKILIK